MTLVCVCVGVCVFFYQLLHVNDVHVFGCLQVADRLFSSFGQDTLDSLFWTAVEPISKKRHYIGVVFHLILALFYVCILLDA